MWRAGAVDSKDTDWKISGDTSWEHANLLATNPADLYLQASSTGRSSRLIVCVVPRRPADEVLEFDGARVRKARAHRSGSERHREGL